MATASREKASFCRSGCPNFFLFAEERVQKAAAAAGVKITPWLRHMVRQVTVEDFPAR